MPKQTLEGEPGDNYEEYGDAQDDIGLVAGIGAQIKIRRELATESASASVRGSAERLTDYLNNHRLRIAAIGGGAISAAAGFAAGAVVAHHHR